MLFLPPDMPNDQLIQVVEQIESQGDVNAIGDKGLKYPAYGPLQIRQPAVDDVNRNFDTTHTADECLGNRELSVWIFERYMDIYATEKRIGRPVTPIDKIRIWNGGPNGWKKMSTLSYAARFKHASEERGYLV